MGLEHAFGHGKAEFLEFRVLLGDDFDAGKGLDLIHKSTHAVNADRVLGRSDDGDLGLAVEVLLEIVHRKHAGVLAKVVVVDADEVGRLRQNSPLSSR